MSEEHTTDPAPKPNPSRPIKPLLRGLAIGMGTVVVLAGVIFVGSALSDPGNSTQAPSVSSTNAATAAYEQGVAALAAGETTKAVTLLGKAVKLDPDNSEAKSALAEAKSRQGSTGGTSGSGSNDSAGTGSESSGGSAGEGSGSDSGSETSETAEQPQIDDPVFFEEIEDMKALLPKSVDGFGLGTAAVSQGTAQVSGTPSDPAMSRAVWSVNDRESAKKAKSFVTDVSESLYKKDVAKVTIDGAHARFATDGTLFASVVYTRGRYVFEVVLTSTTRNPAELRSAAEAAAAAFPDSL